MTTLSASAELHADSRQSAWPSLARGLLLAAATMLSLLAVSLVLLLQPLFLHPALDAAGAPGALGLSAAATRAVSDRTVAELVVGPGTFAFLGPDGRPFYDASEAAHLRDVRLLLYGFLGLGGASLAALALAVGRGWREPAVWRAVARGGFVLAAGLFVLGAFALISFSVAFDLFHRLLFPAGNWSFDPASQRLVQLYPLAFWQIAAAAMGLLGIGGGLAVWALARRRQRRLEGRA